MARKSKSKDSSTSKSKNSFMGNVAKSTKSVFTDTAKDLMPNLSSAVKSNARFVKTTYTDVKDKFKESDIKQSYIYKSGNDIIKNAMSDIKSGNFNNKDRQKKNSEDMFDKLLNFDFDADPTDLDDAFNVGDSVSSEKSSKNDINVSEFNLDLDIETKTDIKTMASFSQANTKISNRGFAMMTAQLRAVSTFQNKNTLKFYEMVEERLNSMDNHLGISSAYYKDLVENNNKSTAKDADPRSLEAAFNMRGFKIEEWIDIYKKNFTDMMSAGSMIGTMMIKPMIADIVNNPLGAAAKWGLKSLIPKGLKSSISDFDKAFGMLPVYLQGKIPAMKEKGGLSGFFANIFDLNKNRVKSDKNAFVKGPVSFDGITKRAITHVIPGYLKRILFALTGNEKDNISYDMEKGKFVMDSEAKKHHREKLRQSGREAIDDNIDSLEKKYVQKLKDNKIVKNDEEASKYIEELREKMAELGKKGKNLSSNIDVSELSSDKKSAYILKDLIKNNGLNRKEKNEINRALADSYILHQQTLRDLTNSDLWQSVYDFGKYSEKKPDKKSTEGILDKIDKDFNKFNKKKDNLTKDKLTKNMKDGPFKDLINAIYDVNEDGKNSKVEDILDKAFYSHLDGGDITDTGKLDKKYKKRQIKNLRNGQLNNPATSVTDELKKLNSISLFSALGLDPSSNSAKRILRSMTSPGSANSLDTVEKSLYRLISGGAKGISAAGSGLLQYATITKEGLALRVKVVGGSLETTEGEAKVKNVEKNYKIRKRLIDKDKKDEEDKIKSQEDSNEKDFKEDLNKPEEITPDDTTKALVPVGERSLTTTNQPEEEDSSFKSIFGDLFRDIFGVDFSKDGILGGGKKFLLDKINSTKAGRLALKYGKKGFNKFKTSKLGKTVFGFGEDILSKGKEYLDKGGFNKEFFKNQASSIFNGAKNTASGFAGNLGKIFRKEMTVKEGVGSFFSGGKKIFDAGKSKVTNGFDRVKSMFKKDNPNSTALTLFNGNNKLAKVANKENMRDVEKLQPLISNAMQIITHPLNAMTTTLGNLTQTVGNSMENVNDSIIMTAETINNTSQMNSDDDSNIIDVMFDELDANGNKTGRRGGKGSRFHNLFRKVKGSKLGGKVGGLLGKGKVLGKGLLSKGAGLLGKAGLMSGLGGAGAGGAGAAAGGAGLLSGLTGIGAGAAGGAGAAAGGAGLLSGLAGLGGSGLMAGAGAALSALAPIALPALAIGGGLFGVKKLFDWRKKKKEEKAQMKAYKEAESKSLFEDDDVEYDPETGKPKEGFFKKMAGFTLLGRMKKAHDNQYEVKRDENGNTILGPDGKPVMVRKEGFMNKLFSQRKDKEQEATASLVGSNGEKIPVGEESQDGSSKLSNFFKRTMMMSMPGGILGMGAAKLAKGINTPKLDENGQPILDENGQPVTALGKISSGLGKLSKAAFLATPIGMMYNMTKKDQIDEAKKGVNSDDPMTRAAEHMKPLGEFATSSSFKNIFGSNGLFSSMFKGLKSAAGGSLSKLGSFFSDFWSNTSGKGNGSGSTGSNDGSFGSGTGANQGSVTLDSSYATGILTNASSIVNKSTKINSKITAEQLEAVFESMGKTEMKGLGKVFIKASEESGLDPLYLVSHAALETGWGTSSILNDKNNWFGIGAFDNSPYESAYGFSNKEAGIIEGAKWIAKNYANKGQDTLYKMVNDPNGHNYATDPGWANKIAEIMLMVANKGGGQVYGGQVGVNGGNNNSSNANGKLGKVLSTAKAMIDAGYPYKLESGACDPSYGAFDCSGLMQYSYKQAGINLPRTTYDQVRQGKGVSISGQYGVGQAQPGDLLFCIPGSRGPEHVMMYAGNNMVHEAANTRTGLITRSVANTSFPSQPVAIRRILNDAGGLAQGTRTSKAAKATDSLINKYRAYDNPLGNKGITASSYNNGTGDYLAQGAKTTAYVANNDVYRDETRNNLMLTMRDSLESIRENTGETNTILMKILDSLINVVNSGNNDIPLNLSAEMSSLFKGY